MNLTVGGGMGWMGGGWDSLSRTGFPRFCRSSDLLDMLDIYILCELQEKAAKPRVVQRTMTCSENVRVAGMACQKSDGTAESSSVRAFILVLNIPRVCGLPFMGSTNKLDSILECLHIIPDAGILQMGGFPL